jgi:hypothetical protein
MNTHCKKVEGDKYNERVGICCPTKDKKVKPDITKTKSRHTVKEARDDNLTALDEMRMELKCESPFIERYIQFGRNTHCKLRYLANGVYDVMAMQETLTRYGKKFSMILQSPGTLQFLSNTKIEYRMQHCLPKEKMKLVMEKNIIFLDEGPVARLTITGKHQKKGFPHPEVYCEFCLSSQLLAKVASRESVEEMGTCITDITVQPDVDKKMQATRGNVNVRPGMNAINDWIHTVKYEDVPWYFKKDNEDDMCKYKVIDAKWIQHKGKMRKVVITSDGNIFRFRSPKLEKYARPGFELHY